MVDTWLIFAIASSMAVKNPGLFLFSSFLKKTLQFLQQINVKNVHPVFGAGIRTHDV